MIVVAIKLVREKFTRLEKSIPQVVAGSKAARFTRQSMEQHL